ncbi:MAG: prepilin-type N-terminal cleavage/methylation domain-containing protein [Myxococcota bacterium]
MPRPSASRTNDRRGAGFTLVEAVVLIAILGILGAVAAPRFLSLRDLEAARAHRQALSDLRLAQHQAAGSGCPVEVDFDSGGYQLRQRSACRSGDFDRALVDPVRGQAPFAIALPEGVPLSSSVDPIVFDALGRLTRADGTPTDVVLRIGGREIAGVGETGFVHVP